MQFHNNQILILISDSNKKNWWRETFVSWTNNINEDWFIDCYWFLSTDFTWSNIHMNIQVKTINWQWRFLILGQSVGLKKKKLKKNNKKSRNRRPWYPRMTLQANNRHIFGLTKCTIYCKKCTCFFSLLLLCSFFRLKELFQVKNGLTTLVFCKFFWKCQKFGRH